MSGDHHHNNNINIINDDIKNNYSYEKVKIEREGV